MISVIGYFALALGQSVCLLGLPPEPASKADNPHPPTFTPQQLVEDFHILRKALEEGHSGIYRYTPKAELDAVFDKTEKALSRPMTCLEFYRLLAPTVGSVKCGHTAVALPLGVETTPNTQRPILPLQVKVLDGKVYVLRDFSSDKGDLAGLEIKSINGTPADVILATMIKATPGDGDAVTGRQHRLRGQRFAINLIDLLGLEAPYKVSCWNPETRQEVARVLEGTEPAQIDSESRARFPRDQAGRKPPELTFLDSDHIAVMKIYQFGNYSQDGKPKQLKNFLKESFEAIKARGTQTLILDLRDNGGGADDLGKELLSYLVDQPFQYYDDLVINAREFSFRKYAANRAPVSADIVELQPNGKYRMVKHPNWGTNQPSAPHFAGKVFALINGGSFSTTSEFLSHLHDRKRATFIGEESAGGYYGNTSGPRALVTLPHTRVKLLLPLMTYYIHVNAGHPAAHGVIPDVPIHYSIRELIDGKDKGLAAALELARKN
jgi:hypothetical protein